MDFSALFKSLLLRQQAASDFACGLFLFLNGLQGDLDADAPLIQEPEFSGEAAVGLGREGGIGLAVPFLIMTDQDTGCTLRQRDLVAAVGEGQGLGLGQRGLVKKRPVFVQDSSRGIIFVRSSTERVS